MNIEEAEGYADLEMWEDAWTALGQLRPAVRASSRGFRFRLRCCPALGRWVEGELLALVLMEEGAADRKDAAAFFLQYAKFDRSRSMDWIKEAIKAWPNCRLKILEDPELFEMTIQQEMNGI